MATTDKNCTLFHIFEQNTQNKKLANEVGNLCSHLARLTLIKMHRVLTLTNVTLFHCLPARIDSLLFIVCDIESTLIL